MGPAATARDIRWRHHAVRGTWVAFGWSLLITLGGADLFGVSGLVAQLAIVAWWATGMVGALRRSVLIGAALAGRVEDGLTCWRGLPASLRDRAQPVADALVKAGVRGDRAGVDGRVDLLMRAVRECGSHPYPGRDLDVDELSTYLDAMKETHRD